MKSAPETVSVLYHLHLRDGRWRVTEIVTDGSHMVRGYRTMIRRILRNQGFEVVMRRLRERLRNSHSAPL